MKRAALIVGVALLAWPAIAPRTEATVGIQKEAKELGYPAGDCIYCHTFDSKHSLREAMRLGMGGRNLDCMGCHGPTLPKSGPRVLNARGLWMTADKEQRRAPRVDVQSLKDYREPSPSPPAPGRTAPAKPLR